MRTSAGVSRMNRPSAIDPLLRLEPPHGHGLSVDWVWMGDRYQHRLTLVVGGIASRLLTSAEDLFAHGTTASVPWQEVVAHEDRGDAAILGVGRAAGAHVSAVVQRHYWPDSDPLGHESEDGLQFEYAARPSRSLQVALQCHYVLGAAVQGIATHSADSARQENQRICLLLGPHRVHVAVHQATLELDALGRQLIVKPIPHRWDSSQTVVWKCRFALSSI